MGRRADADVGGRDDHGRAHDVAGRGAIRPQRWALLWALLVASSVARLFGQAEEVFAIRGMRLTRRRYRTLSCSYARLRT